MTDATEWHRYVPLDLNQASSGTAAPPDAGASAGDSSSDHALGLAVVFGCAFGSAVSILYLSYRVAEFLFGVRL